MRQLIFAQVLTSNLRISKLDSLTLKYFSLCVAEELIFDVWIKLNQIHMSTSPIRECNLCTMIKIMTGSWCGAHLPPPPPPAIHCRTDEVTWASYMSLKSLSEILNSLCASENTLILRIYGSPQLSKALA